MASLSLSCIRSKTWALDRGGPVGQLWGFCSGHNGWDLSAGLWETGTHPHHLTQASSSSSHASGEKKKNPYTKKHKTSVPTRWESSARGVGSTETVLAVPRPPLHLHRCTVSLGRFSITSIEPGDKASASLIRDLEVKPHRTAYSNWTYGSEESPLTLKLGRKLLHNYSPLSQSSGSVMSNSLRPHELQHARPPRLSPTSGVYWNLCPWVGAAIQPSHPLSSPSSPALNLSQHQGHFKWVSSSHQVLKILEFQLQHHPSNEQSGLISFRMDWLDLLAVQGTLKSLCQHLSSKASILHCSAFFMIQLSHPYMTTGKTIALTRQTFVGKVSLILFLPKYPTIFS